MVKAEKILLMALIQAVFSVVTVMSAVGAQPHVFLKLDRHTASLTDTLSLRVVVQGTSDTKSPPALHNMDGFTVTGRGTSSSIKMINGRVTSSIEYNYMLIPRHPGKFRIGPAEVEIDGVTYHTGREEVTITKAAVQTGKEKGDIFLVASISSPKAVPEQPLVYTLKLYHRVSVSNLSLQLPKSPDFDLKKAADPAEYESRYNNYQYHVIELKYILTPIARGKIEVPPALIRMEKIQRNLRIPGSLLNDPFFSFGRSVPYSAVSNPVKIKIKALPSSGRPADFTGLVGEYDMDVVLEPDKVKAGGSSTLTVTIKGTGNVQRIPTLKLPDIPGCRLYADEPAFEKEITEKGETGKKVMKWAIVPEKSGRFKIPEMGFSYYSLKKGRYESLTSEPLTLVSEGGPMKTGHPPAAGKPVSASPDRAPEKKHGITELGRDIFPVHTDADSLVPEGKWMPDRWLLLALIAVFPLIYFSLMVSRLIKRDRDKAEIRAGRAAARLKEGCNNISCPEDMLMIIRDYINDRFRTEYGSITQDDIVDTLGTAGIKQDTINAVTDIVGMLEQAIYAGKNADEIPVKKLLENIDRIEAELK